jgi:hypothetical protein
MNNNGIEAIVLIRRVARSNQRVQTLYENGLLTEEIIGNELELLIRTNEQANTNVIDLESLEHLLEHFEIENVFNIIEEAMIKRLGRIIINS